MAQRTLVLLLALAVAVSATVWLAARSPGGEPGTLAAPGRAARAPGPATTDGALRDVAGAPGPGGDPEAPQEIVIRRAIVPPGAWRARLVGRLLDERSGEGLELVRVRVDAEGSTLEECRTDAAGRFASREALGRDRLRLVAEDVITGERLGRRGWWHVPGEDGGAAEPFEWPLEVGPTYRVGLVGAPPRQITWRARLVERVEPYDDREWPWTTPLADAQSGALWVRYADHEHLPDGGWVPTLVLESTDGRFRGAARVPSTVGAHVVVVEVEAVNAALTGFVRDQDGRPVEAAVFVLHRGATWDEQAEVPKGSTDDAGRFELHGLAPGPVRVLVATDHRPLARARLELVAGEVREQDFVVESLVLAGDVRGTLVGPPEGGGPFALVRLTSADGVTDLFDLAGFDLFGDSDEPERASFEFEDLPEGRFELTLLPLDGRRYAPRSLWVSPPTEDARFTTDQLAVDETRPAPRLVVRDGETGEVLDDAVFLPYLAPFWGSEPIDWDEGEELERSGGGLDLRWVVAVPAHRPRFVALGELVRSGQGSWEIALEPGFGAALVVLNGEHMLGGAQASFDEILPMPGLPGAQVVADGRVLAESGPSGLALCASDAPLDTFDVRLPGWSVLSVERFRGHAATPDGIGFVLMARD